MSEGISRRQFLRWGLGTALGAAFTGRFPALAHSGEPKKVPNAGLGAPILSVNTDARFVSLTFDDLWYEYTAERIGRSYARRGIRLTFFPIGHAVRNNLERPYEGFENLYPRLRDMGHEIGCHLFTHKVIRGYSLQQLIDEEMGARIRRFATRARQGFLPRCPASTLWHRYAAIAPTFLALRHSARVVGCRYARCDLFVKSSARRM